VRFWLEIAYLRGCISRACAESGVNLLPTYKLATYFDL